MNKIRSKFYRECAIWKRKDHTLAIAFKAASLPKTVEQAVCEMRGEKEFELTDEFYAECIELIRARDTNLRSRLLHIMRKREGMNKNQLTFDFSDE